MRRAILTYVLALPMLAGSAHAASYVITPLITTKTSSLGRAAINDRGDVAFTVDGHVFRAAADGSVVQLDGGRTANPVVSINNAGQVAFLGSSAGGRTGVYIGGDSGVATVVESTGGFAGYEFTAPAINDLGQVAFNASYTAVFLAPTTVRTVYRGDASGLDVIYTETRLSGVGRADAPDINNLGQVAFFWSSKAGATYVNAIYLGDGASLVTRIGSHDFVRPRTDSVVVNDSGLVLSRWQGLSSFDDALVSGDSTGFRKILGPDGPFRMIGDGDFDVSNVSLNDLGRFAFTSSLDAGGYGLFAGPDPVDDLVIKTGMELDGSTVVDLHLHRHGLNNLGQLAFSATLADGRTGIFLATLRSTAVPEPGSFAMMALGIVGAGVLLVGGADGRRSREAYFGSGCGEER